MSSDWGAKISKPGYDVRAATEDQLVFTSKYNSLKIKAAQSGTWTVTAGNKFGLRDITLTGYTNPPFYLLFIEVNNKNYFIRTGGYIEDVDGVNDLFLYTYIDDSTPPILKIAADLNANPTFAADRNLNYYLYLGVDDL